MNQSTDLIPSCTHKHAAQSKISIGIRTALCGASVMVCLVFQTTARAADERHWELSSYRIQVHLAVDTSARPQADLREKIANELKQRIYATLYPLWSVELTLPPKDSMPKRADSQRGFDKEMFLKVTATVGGYRLECREVDHTVNTQGPVLRRTVRQGWMLPEQCFDLLRATFAPLVKIRRVPEDANHMLAYFKGSRLPRRSKESPFTQLGSVYQPLRVRTNRQGDVQTNGIAPVPWTYLTLEEMRKEVGFFRVHTGTRHPFGVRRRGRVEHFAIALRYPPGNTRVRFFAQHDQTQALSGYEVFRRESAEQPSQPLGLTNSQGAIEVSSLGTRVSTLFLRSDGKLLAKVPIAPGAVPVVEVPVADDIARLNAQASLTSLREQLIDLVARRNILMARVRDRMANDQFEEAQELLSQLDSLPGRAHFAQLLSVAERNQRNRSNAPRVQARIEKMFADTRKLLGRFLSTRQISELQSELRVAIQKP